MPYVIGLFDSAFDFFEKFTVYAQKEKFFIRAQSIVKQFDLIFNFINTSEQADEKLLIDKLMLDWVLMEKPRRFPLCLNKKADFNKKEYIRLFFNSEENIKKYLPEYLGMTPSQISRMCHIVFCASCNDRILIDFKRDKIDRCIKIY
jgi:hypothetical protein